KDESLFAMPAASNEPGAMDAKGSGLFRGRFGTDPQSHEAGTVVILFPFRYWDLWNEMADAPEMSYFGLRYDQPGAFWTSTFWEAEEAAVGGPELGVLMRSDPKVPWDADPDSTDGLDLLLRGSIDGEAISLGRQSDSLQWRVFVNYAPGSFSATDGSAHGWKTTPRLKHLGLEFFAPGRVLQSIDN
ncbi:MAG: hypothetical protein ACI841_005480, partial [Planctomycetota bacterium]